MVSEELSEHGCGFSPIMPGSISSSIARLTRRLDKCWTIGISPSAVDIKVPDLGWLIGSRKHRAQSINVACHLFRPPRLSLTFSAWTKSVMSDCIDTLFDRRGTQRIRDGQLGGGDDVVHATSRSRITRTTNTHFPGDGKEKCPSMLSSPVNAP